jgi:hypothetical protein
MEGPPQDLYAMLGTERGAELRSHNEARLAELERSSAERRERLALLRALMSPAADRV